MGYLGAMSVSGISIFTNPFNDFLFEVIHIPVPTKQKKQRLTFLNLISQSTITNCSSYLNP